MPAIKQNLRQLGRTHAEAGAAKSSDEIVMAARRDHDHRKPQFRSAVASLARFYRRQGRGQKATQGISSVPDRAAKRLRLTAASAGVLAGVVAISCSRSSMRASASATWRPILARTRT